MLTSRRDQSIEQGWSNHSPATVCCYSAPDIAPEASMKKKSLRIVLYDHNRSVGRSNTMSYAYSRHSKVCKMNDLKLP